MATQNWAAPSVEQVKSGSADAKKDLRGYLRAFGYLDPAKDPDNSDADIDDSDDYAALRGLQHFLGLQQSGHYDQETETAMNEIRCGVPDNDTIANSRSARPKWHKHVITWKLLNASPDLGNNRFADARQQIGKAFKEWDRHMPNNRLVESNAPKADIMVSFQKLNHNDGFPFEGPGKVLAHAFFPVANSGKLAGDVHFDEGEKWGEKFLQQVALHEIGHSLGLEHSHDRSAVMFPIFRAKSNLDRDDIVRIKRLY